MIGGADRLLEKFHAVFRDRRLHPVTLVTSADPESAVEWTYRLSQRILCERNFSNPDPRADLKLEACGICGPCVRIGKRSSEGFLHLKPAGLQFKIDEAARVAAFISRQSSATARFVLLEQADLLNPQAANLLLKTLEEPPPRTYFFLTARSPQDVLVTLRSRAQHFKLVGSEARPEVSTAEMEEARARALTLFKELRGNSYHAFFARWKAEVADRAAALQVLQHWQGLLRDVIFHRLEPETRGVVRPAEPAVDARASSSANMAERLVEGLGNEQVHALFQLCLKAERDVKNNVDRNLAIELLWQSHRLP